MESRTVGILGGGQLGRMMVEAANRLGIRIAILDPSGPSSPAGQLSHLCIEGDYKDATKIKELVSISDIITTEIEHVNANALEELEAAGYNIQPTARTLLTIQDKYQQKVFLSSNNIPVSDFKVISTMNELHDVGREYGYPFLLKNRKLAYDGKGNAIINKAEDIEEAYNRLSNNNTNNELYVEKYIPFVKELAIMIVRTELSVFEYPVVETIQKDNICHLVTAPAQISPIAMKAARTVAMNAIKLFNGKGVYGVELFLLNDDTVLLNEIAPRPHNSGHYTIEGCEIDQFEMHLRAVLDMPCPIPKMRTGAAMMINVLGGDTMEDTKAILRNALNIRGANIHWYGKSENRQGRKMAHITVTGDDFEVLRTRVELLGLTKEEHGIEEKAPRVGIIMGRDSDLPTMKDAADILDSFHVSYELTIVSAHRTPTRMYSYAQSAAERGIEVIIAGAGGAAHLPGMVAALTPLPVIGVPIKTSTLNGNDSLLSIVQMPRGIPVATVAIGNATNAALLAVRVLAAQDKDLLTEMDAYMLRQEEEVIKKASILETIGHAKYLTDKLNK